MELIVALIHHVPVPVSLLHKGPSVAMSRLARPTVLPACLPASLRNPSPAPHWGSQGVAQKGDRTALSVSSPPPKGHKAHLPGMF